MDIPMDIHEKNLWIWMWIWMGNFISTTSLAFRQTSGVARYEWADHGGAAKWGW